MQVEWTVAGPEPAAIDRMRGILRQAGLAIFPTETLYGLGCDPRAGGAVRRLVSLKGRTAGKPLPLIAASAAEALTLAMLSPKLASTWNRLAEAFWPGPLTVVVPARPGLAAEVLAGGATVGVRVSAHPVARRLADLCGGCIVATSANPAGAPAAHRPGDLDARLRKSVDLLVTAGDCPEKRPSTVVRLTRGGLEIVRAGPVDVAALRRAGVEVESAPSGT